MCVGCVCVCMCDIREAGGNSQVSSSVLPPTSFETGYLIEPVAHLFGWADWLENSRDPPVSALQIPPHTAFKQALRI